MDIHRVLPFLAFYPHMASVSQGYFSAGTAFISRVPPCLPFVLVLDVWLFLLLSYTKVMVAWAIIYLRKSSLIKRHIARILNPSLFTPSVDAGFHMPYDSLTMPYHYLCAQVFLNYSLKFSKLASTVSSRVEFPGRHQQPADGAGLLPFQEPEAVSYFYT